MPLTEKNKDRFTPIRRPRRRPARGEFEGTLTPGDVERIMAFEEAEPFDALGPHLLEEEGCLIIRAFLPRAVEAWVRLRGKKRQRSMKLVHPGGFYEALFEDVHTIPDYVIGHRDAAGEKAEAADPYAFSTEITDFDLYLLGEGRHFHSYDKFGARPLTFRGVKGVHFAVWAPNAVAISIVGDFNHWLPGVHPMTRIHFSGVWGLFIPGLKEGDCYKYAIRSSADGEVRMKADPYAFGSELRPKTGSVVTRLDDYHWKDSRWMKKRAKTDFLHEPVSIYELHPGSWRRDVEKGGGFIDYAAMARELVPYVKAKGYTHIELLPVAEHPLDESWGYQVTGYFSPTRRFGSPQDFMAFVDECHRQNIGVILDWVPAHFPKDAHGLNEFDGRQIYAYENWKKGEHREWGTLVFDYGRPEVQNFLISNALFWLDKYHIDGLRVDAVASMLYLDYSRKDGEWETNQYGGRENLEAVQFIRLFNETVHGRYPGVLTIAEESTAWGGVSHPTYRGGLGFSMKWNMGWMHDTLEYFQRDPVYRKYHQGMLTFSLIYAFSENFVLPISHDEVVYGKRSLLEKMPGDDWQKFANCRLFFAYMFAHPGKKLNFMTNDLGQRSEWNCNASMDWHVLNYEPHQKLNYLVEDLHRLYRREPALYDDDFSPGGFEWIDFRDAEGSVLSFIRRARDGSRLVVALNMTPIPRQGYRIGVPEEGFYQELLNTDAVEYGGSGFGNAGGVHSDHIAWHDRPHSIGLNLPPLAAVVLRVPGKRQ